MEEHFFQCPYCWETISMLIDASVAEQFYIEDCEICCNPLELHVVFKNNTLLQFNIRNTSE